jgi:ABC-type nitrate/sulfonate/bicarbonate transport system substrate-binding protein
MYLKNRRERMERKNIYIITGIVVIILILGSILSFNLSENSENDLSVRLSWLMNSNQAGFVTAVEKGFYEDEGLKVINRPGGIDFPSIQLVASGSDDIGVQSGAETILLARQNGIPIKAIAVLDKKSPYVFFSVKENNIVTPKDFEGKIVAISYGRPLEMVYRALLSKENVDLSKITEVKKSPAILTLFSGAVDIQPGFVSDLIFAQEAGKEEGIELNVIRPADYGIESYGYTIFATDEMIENNPEVIEKYLRATLKGWEYSLNNPDESIDYVLSEAGNELDREAQLKALKARKDFVLSDETPVGWMEEEVWQEMHDSLLEQGLLEASIDIDSVYTNEFIDKIYS